MADTGQRRASQAVAEVVSAAMQAAAKAEAEAVQVEEDTEIAAD